MKFIKKSAALIAVLAILLSLCACKGEGTTDESNSKTGDSSASKTVDMTVDEIMETYCTVYDTSKASGSVLGVNSMEIPRIVFDGKQNNTMEGIVGTLLKSLFKEQTNKPLPPSEDPKSIDTCLLKGSDVESATYTDNGDGTATIHFVPKGVHSPKCLEDPQGKTFNLFADLKKSIGGVSQISWAQGTIDDNFDAYYNGGYVDCTFDTKTNMITNAKYVSSCDLKMEHVNVMGVIKDKTVEITMQYIETF